MKIGRASEPGRYSFSLRLQTEASSLVEVDGLVVCGGETLRDPRLQNLDLRGVLHTITLALHYPDPPLTPVAGQIHYRETGGEGFPNVIDAYPGEVDITTAFPAVDVRVVPTGCRSLTLLDVREDREIQLEPGFRSCSCTAGRPPCRSHRST